MIPERRAQPRLAINHRKIFVWMTLNTKFTGVQIKMKSIIMMIFIALGIVIVVAEQKEALLNNLQKSKANFTLAGLFPLHDAKGSREKCCRGNNIKPDGMFDALAMIYAVETINQNEVLLPGITLAVDIQDTCRSVNVAVKDYLSFDFVADFYHGGFQSSSSKPGRTFAVIGSSTSVISHSVSTLSNVFNVPVISYKATSPLLSNQDRFRSFFRTAPSDKLLVMSVLDFLQKSNWNLFSIIHTRTDYATSAFDLILSEIRKRKLSQKKKDVCLMSHHVITPDSKEDVIKKLVELKSKKSNVTVVLAHSSDAFLILKEAAKMNFANTVWILSGGFTPKICKLRREFSGRIITIDFKRGNITKFVNFVNETVKKSSGGNSSEIRSDLRNFTLQIQNDNSLLNKISFTIPYVIDAVMAAAHALHMTLKCTSKNCRIADFSQSDVMKNLYQVNFTSQLGVPFSFDKYGDTKGTYSFKVNSNESESCMLTDIAEWTQHSPAEDHNKKHFLAFNDTISQKYISKCDEDCPEGHGKLLMKMSGDCCWTCKKCTGKEYSSITSGLCEKCPDRSVPNDLNSDCVKLTENKLNLTGSTHGVIILCLSILGLLLVIFIFVVFFVHRNTHVVRASNKELTVVLLLGISLGYMTTVVAAVAQTRLLCRILFYIDGLSFSMTIGSLFTKANRMYRIFRKEIMMGGELKYMSVAWQLFIISIFVTLEMSLTTIMAFHPTDPMREEESITDKSIITFCHINFWMLCTVQLFNVSLTMLCTYQAFLARNVPGEYNDSRSIFAVAIAMFLHTFAYIVMSFSSNTKGRLVLKSIPAFLNATITIICLFAYKVYVILFRPRLNAPPTTHGSLGTFSPMPGDRKRKHNSVGCIPFTTPTRDIGIANIGFDPNLHG